MILWCSSATSFWAYEHSGHFRDKQYAHLSLAVLTYDSFSMEQLQHRISSRKTKKKMECSGKNRLAQTPNIIYRHAGGESYSWEDVLGGRKRIGGTIPFPRLQVSLPHYVAIKYWAFHREVGSMVNGHANVSSRGFFLEQWGRLLQAYSLWVSLGHWPCDAFCYLGVLAFWEQ